MKIYLVGGAVRDALLGLPVTERDWVVVGAQPETLQKQGYISVGKHFPVFLHPRTHEEYALARTERKTGPGHRGFKFIAAPEVTLEEDLKRRDLTINAIAQDETGHLIDPYGGQADLNAHQLRHVSSAFSEDPLRILRTARFAAKLQDFSVHPETLMLMKSLVNSGELSTLAGERIWTETEKALGCQAPERYFEVLQSCGALPHLLPTLCDHLPAALDALHAACKQTHTLSIRYAALLGHLNTNDVKTINQRLNTPKKPAKLAELVAETHGTFLQAQTLSAKQLLNLLFKLDVLRQPERFAQWLTTCSCLHHASTQIGALKTHLQAATKILRSTPIKDLIKPNDTAQATQNLPKQIADRRLATMENFIKKLKKDK